MSKRSPFPIPFGWFQVAWADELKPGQVVPLQYFGRHLALWRDEQGAPHVNDAFCPHLGAHFGHGGTVHGEELVCPFHGWRFDAEGNNTLIPYSERTNRKACVRAYPTVERNGLWHALTPQLFPLGRLHRALATVIADGAEVTDESQAMERLFGRSVPVSSSKSFLGHTLGASGIIELPLNKIIV